MITKGLLNKQLLRQFVKEHFRSLIGRGTSTFCGTKKRTAFAIMLLHDMKQLNIDQLANQYLPPNIKIQTKLLSIIFSRIPRAFITLKNFSDKPAVGKRRKL